jgi:hypothetical protein
MMVWVLIFIAVLQVQGQQQPVKDTIHREEIVNGPFPIPGDTANQDSISTGWADRAVTIGYYGAPVVLGLMFVSALLSEWNAGYAGIPASLGIIAVPPVVFAGGRSVDLPPGVSRPRAQLGWTLYALSVIPASLALYGFSTEWGASMPLTIASGVLGSASIIAMATYTNLRMEVAGNINNAGNDSGSANASWNISISPLPGGALATLSCRF